VRAYKNSANQSQKDARVHCAVLNVRPDTHHMTPPDPPPHQGRQRYEIQAGPARGTVTRSLRTQQRAYDHRPANDSGPHATPR
jgi:hypothetical protein